MRIRTISALVVTVLAPVIAVAGCSSAHSAAPASTAPVSSASTQANVSFTMPSEVGRVLQDAQDDLQRVSGNPLYFSKSHDLIGSRFQVLDRDWQVCSQNVAAGATVPGSVTVDFGVVKLSENCP